MTPADISSLIDARRTVRPRHLHAPGPDDEQLAHIVRAAAAAPDHGELRPWRFVLVTPASRPALAEAFERALVQRDPLATATQREQAREKAFRAPTLLLAIVRLARPDAADAADIPDDERLVSAGCAIQNMLLMATSLGFGSALTSGKAMASAVLANLFSVTAQEQAVCFVSLGTAAKRKPARVRPDPASFVRTLPAASGEG